jgi:hypothetical protein
MRNSILITRKRLTPVLAASVLLTGGIGASLLFAGGTADAATDLPAAPCAGANASGAACTIAGTLTVTSGVMTLTAPPAVGWAETISGADQQLADPTGADETYTVDDATGTAPGWHVTAAATPFTVTTTVAGAAPLGTVLGTAGTAGVPAVPTFATNGSGPTTGGVANGLMADTTAPTAACAGTSTCTLPTDVVGTGTVGSPAPVVAYPVNITYGNAATGAASPGAPTGHQTTPVSIYSADAGTGLGTIVIGGAGAANPVGWWINVPSNTLAGSYVSTISLELIAAP